MHEGIREYRGCIQAMKQMFGLRIEQFPVALQNCIDTARCRGIEIAAVSGKHGE
jgi:hypothetical protein